MRADNGSDTTPIEFVTSHGWEHKVMGGEIWVAPCPVCQNRDAADLKACRGFSVNEESGAAHCLKCGWAGNLYLLATEVLDERAPRLPPSTGKRKQSKPTDPLPALDDYEAAFRLNEPQAFLAARGLTAATAAAWHLGYDRGQRAVAIPLIVSEDAGPVCYKFRSCEAEPRLRYFKSRGYPLVPAGLHLLDRDHPRCIITEGEIDAMALHQVGLRNVVSITSGAGTFKPEWRDHFDPFRQIILAYDNDDKGREGMIKAAEVLGRDRCLACTPPDPWKDWGECVAKGKADKASLEPIFRHARPMSASVAFVPWREVSSLVRRRIQEGPPETVRFDPSNLCKVMDGLGLGEITLLFARTDQGKTTLARTIALSAMRAGAPCLYSSAEFDLDEVGFAFARMVTGKDRASLTEQDMDAWRSELDLPLHVLRERTYTVADLIREIRVAVWCHGVRLVVLDPLYFLMTPPPGNMDETAHRAAYFRELVREFRTMPAHLIVVHNARKGDGMPTAEDAKGAQELGGDSKNMLTIQAGTNDPSAKMRPFKVRVIKAKRTGETRDVEVQLLKTHRTMVLEERWF